MRIELKNKKNVLLIGIICAICMFATAQDVATQTIQLKNGSCELDKVLDMSRIGGYVEKPLWVDFKYTLNDSIKEEDIIKVLSEELVDKGVFVVGRNRYKAHSIAFKYDEQEKIQRNGVVTLDVWIPTAAKPETIIFVINRQRIPLKDKIKDFF